MGSARTVVRRIVEPTRRCTPMAGCPKCKDSGVVRQDWYPMPVWVACPECREAGKQENQAA